MSAPYEVVQDNMAAYRRSAFMLAVDHLISPWKYRPEEISEREMILRKLNWQRESQNKHFTKLEEIPISPGSES